MSQAKKEELWHAAKKAGEGADKTTDRGYLDATKAIGERGSCQMGSCMHDKNRL